MYALLKQVEQRLESLQMAQLGEQGKHLAEYYVPYILDPVE
jgi:hypothetical protein